MRLPLLTCAFALVAVVPAHAAPSSREVSTEYTGAALAGAGDNYFGMRCGVQCVEFTTAHAGERVLRIKLTDATGRAVGWVAETEVGVAATGCGSGVVKSAPGVHWWVSTAVRDSCQAAPTSGMIAVTLTAR